MTIQATSSVILSRDSVFRVGAVIASWASMASTAVSWMRSVRKMAAAITRKSTCPARNTCPSFGEPRQQRLPVVHLRGRPPAADAQFGADLGGNRLPIIDTPELVHGIDLVHAAHGDGAHRQQLPRERGPLGLLGITHGLEQFTITATFEHISDSPGATDDPPGQAQTPTCGRIRPWG